LFGDVFVTGDEDSEDEDSRVLDLDYEAFDELLAATEV